MSTSIPSRFISRTTRSPQGVRPWCLGVSVAASAQRERDVVGERHVAGAELIEGAELGQVVLDRHAPLDPDQRRDLARLDDPLDIVGRIRHRQVVGIALDHPVDQVDLLGDGPRGVGMLARDVDRPELRLQAPLAHPGDIGLAAWRAFGDDRGSRT